MWRSLWKPWFVWRPRQIGLRLVRGLAPASPGYRSLMTAWGLPVLADPTKTIGRSIWTTGIYDLAVSEIIVRLSNPGDTVIDAGANIGYMSLLSASAVGHNGRVLSFEPHPELFSVLQRNIEQGRGRAPIAAIEAHQAALGAEAGTATLLIPGEMATNDGLARIVQDAASDAKTISVQTLTIDDALGSNHASVMKLDVEGFELSVLKGASRAMEARRIKHIVFEDHVGRGSEVVKYLEQAGYRVFSIGWTMRGLSIAPIEQGKLATDYEAPSYLATFEAAEAIARCGQRGWSVLRKNLIPKTPAVDVSREPN